MQTIILIALASAGVSFTITWTSIFSSLRKRVAKIHPKLDELIHCPWCLNHYVSLVAMVCVGGSLGVIDFIVTWAAIVAFGGLVHSILLTAYEPVQKEEVRRRIENTEETLRYFNSSEENQPTDNFKGD